MKKLFSILAIATLMSCTYECNGQTIGVGSMIDYKIGATICR